MATWYFERVLIYCQIMSPLQVVLHCPDLRLTRMLWCLLAVVLLPFNLVMADSTEKQNPEIATSINLLDYQWRLISDQVMGGVSNGRLEHDHLFGRDCLCLRGSVSTENNGGFIQMAVDLVEQGLTDGSAYAGLKLSVSGNQEAYNVHLRTAGLWLPWQSYRASFQTDRNWQQITLPFDGFQAYKTGRALDTSQLKRIGLVAIGRDFEAELCVSEIYFYRD